MKTRLTDRQRREFCRRYLACMDAQRSAEECGFPDGCGLLQRADVRSELETMRAEADNICRADAVRRLCEVAFGRSNDALRLVRDSTLTAQEIGKLDLASVAEFRQSGSGGVEIKFFDRVKALEILCGILGGGADSGAAEEFFHAIEDGAEEAETWADE